MAIKENFSFWRGDDDAGTTTGQLVASRALKYYRSYSPLHEHLRKIILQQGKLPATCPRSLGWQGELAPEPAHSSPGRQGVGTQTPRTKSSPPERRAHPPNPTSNLILSSNPASATGSSLAHGPPAVCHGVRKVTFLNVHIPKAAGSSSECTLHSFADDAHTLVRTAKSVWPFDEGNVSAARAGVAFHEIGNHATYEDFVSGLKGAPSKVRHTHPVGACPGSAWSPGGHACGAFAQASSSCAALVTWVQHPVKRFVSSFYEHAGRGSPLKHASPLSRRYDLGTISPEQLARWEKPEDFRSFLFDNPTARRNYMTWNLQTQYLGDTRLSTFHKASNRWGVRSNTAEGRAMLQLAKQRMATMDFVGLTSRFHDSITLLSWWLGLPPLNVTCSSNLERKLGLKANLTMDAPPLGLSAEGRRVVADQNALDMELFAFAQKLFEQRWALMLARAPERIASDRYTCHKGPQLHCLPTEARLNPYYSGRQRCTTYCTNRRTEGGPLGEQLRRAYASNCPLPLSGVGSEGILGASPSTSGSDIDHREAVIICPMRTVVAKGAHAGRRA